MAAERIQPALSSIGVGRGGAQVLQPIDPRQEIKPNQVVEDYKTQLQQRAAQAQKDKELDLVQMRKFQDLRGGIYNLNNEVREEVVQDFYRKSVEEGADPNKALGDAISQLQNLQKTETEILQPMIKELTKVGEDGSRYGIYDDEGRYVEPDQVFSFLTNELQNSEEAQQALRDGTYNQWLQSKSVDIKNRSLKYDPSFSLGGEMLNEFKKFSSLPGVSDKTDIGAAFQELENGADLKTVLESRPDLRDEFMDYLGTRTDLAGKWATNYAVNEGMSPYTLKTGEGEFMGLAMDAMLEEAENVFLPAPQKGKRMSISRTPEGAKRGGFSDEDLQIAKDVKRDVNTFQDTGDATEINKYLAPYGVFAEVDKEANTAQFFREKVSASGKKTVEPVTQQIKLDDAEGLYNVVSRVDRNIKREAIDLVEFEDPTKDVKGDETLKTDITKIMQGKEGEVLEKFEGVEVERKTFSPDVLKVDGREFEISDEEEAKAAFEYLETRGYGKKKKGTKQAEPKFIAPNGVAYTKQQLLGAGWNESQINALKRQ